MHFQFVSGIFRSLCQSSNTSKAFPNLPKQGHIRRSPSCLSRDPFFGVRKYSEERSLPFLLPGGGLEKFQGRFKEEKYFNVNDQLLLAQMRQSGFRFKCEKSSSNWREYERMASACSRIVALRQSSMMNRNRNSSEECFFLQEQKSLIDRILEVLKNFAFNRRNNPHNYPPYSHGNPFGPPYYHHPSGGMRPGSGEEGVRNQSNETQTDEDLDKSDDAQNGGDPAASGQNGPSENESESERRDDQPPQPNEWQSSGDQERQNGGQGDEK